MSAEVEGIGSRSLVGRSLVGVPDFFPESLLGVPGVMTLLAVFRKSGISSDWSLSSEAAGVLNPVKC